MGGAAAQAQPALPRGSASRCRGSQGRVGAGAAGRGYRGRLHGGSGASRRAFFCPFFILTEILACQDTMLRTVFSQMLYE